MKTNSIIENDPNARRARSISMSFGFFFLFLISFYMIQSRHILPEARSSIKSESVDHEQVLNAQVLVRKQKAKGKIVFISVPQWCFSSFNITTNVFKGLKYFFNWRNWNKHNRLLGITKKMIKLLFTSRSPDSINKSLLLLKDQLENRWYTL